MRAPDAFGGGLRPDDGGDWICAGTEWRRNPRIVIPPVYRHVVGLWARCRSEMGAGHLPEAGGVNDQPAWLMRAFGLLDAAEAEFGKREGA